MTPMKPSPALHIWLQLKTYHNFTTSPVLLLFLLLMPLLMLIPRWLPRASTVQANIQVARWSQRDDPRITSTSSKTPPESSLSQALRHLLDTTDRQPGRLLQAGLAVMVTLPTGASTQPPDPTQPQTPPSLAIQVTTLLNTFEWMQC